MILWYLACACVGLYQEVMTKLCFPLVHAIDKGHRVKHTHHGPILLNVIHQIITIKLVQLDNDEISRLIVIIY